MGRLVHQDVLHAFGLIGERDGGQLSLVSAGAEQTGDGDELQNLFQDFQREPAVQLHSRGAQQRADGSRGSALFADDLSQVGGSDS